MYGTKVTDRDLRGNIRRLGKCGALENVGFLSGELLKDHLEAKNRFGRL